MTLSVVDGVLECKQSVSTNQQITAKQWLVFRDTRKYLSSPGAKDRQSKIKIAFFAMKHFENLNFFSVGSWTIPTLIQAVRPKKIHPSIHLMNTKIVYIYSEYLFSKVLEKKQRMSGNNIYYQNLTFNMLYRN